MEEHTLTVAVDQLHIPYWVDLDAHEHVKALIEEKCDGGDGEYDEPANILIRKMFSSNTIKEWEAIDITSVGLFSVFENVRIEFEAKE